MNPFSWFFLHILYQPMFNLLVGLYDLIPNMGVVIIFVTIIIRILLFPLYQKQLKAQRSLQNLNPELEAIKVKYKDDKEAQSKAMMEFYKEKKVNPLSSCLPLLIQLPILIALYQVFMSGLQNPDFTLLYSFIKTPESLSPMFFGSINLATTGNWVLAILAGATQMWQTWMMMPKKDTKKKEIVLGADGKPVKKQSTPEELTQAMNRNMMFFMPLLTVWFAFQFPAGLALYWVVTTLFAIAQQAFILKKNKVSYDTPTTA